MWDHQIPFVLKKCRSRSLVTAESTLINQGRKAPDAFTDDEDCQIRVFSGGYGWEASDPLIDEMCVQDAG